MLRALLFFVFNSVVFASYSQQPVLVTDFNPGPEDSFDEFNYLGITLGDRLILPIKSSTTGLELGVLDGDNLSILKDINEGEASSNPFYLTSFKGKIYFSAFDAVNGGSIWATDGTSEGTVLKFSHGGSVRPTGLIVSDSDHLFYTYEDKLYKTDGDSLDMIFDGVTFLPSSEQRSNNYTLYNGDLAFTTISDSKIEIYVVEGDNVILKGMSAQYQYMNTLFGLKQVEAGLILGMETFFSHSPDPGTYVLNDGDSTITRLLIAGDKARRIENYNQQSSLAWVAGKGYYLVNGRSGEEVRLVNSSMVSMQQGMTIDHSIFGDYITFVAGIDNWSSSKYLYVSDGTETGTKRLNGVGSLTSNMVSTGPYSFIAKGTTNNFTPELWMVDAEQGTSSIFFQFSTSAVRSNSILLVGIVNDRLYYIGGLDDNVGRELYYFELNLPTNNEDHFASEPQLEVIISANSYQLISNSYDPYRVEIYSLSGQLIEFADKVPNSIYDISHLSGILILRFTQGNKMLSKKVFCQGRQ